MNWIHSRRDTIDCAVIGPVPKGLRRAGRVNGSKKIYTKKE
jgi:hypothetical protein